MITRFQSTPLPLPPRLLHSKSGSVIQFGHPGGHVHTEKCNQGQCDQSKPKEGQAEERQFFLRPIFEKVRAFFQNIWSRIQNICNGIKEWWSPSSKKPTAPPTEEKATPKTEPAKTEPPQEQPKIEQIVEPSQEQSKPMDNRFCPSIGEGSPPPSPIRLTRNNNGCCGGKAHNHGRHSHGHKDAKPSQANHSGHVH
jgi:hypothetical protein